MFTRQAKGLFQGQPNAHTKALGQWHLERTPCCGRGWNVECYDYQGGCIYVRKVPHSKYKYVGTLSLGDFGEARAQPLQHLQEVIGD